VVLGLLVPFLERFVEAHCGLVVVKAEWRGSHNGLFPNPTNQPSGSDYIT